MTSHSQKPGLSGFNGFRNNINPLHKLYLTKQYMMVLKMELRGILIITLCIIDNNPLYNLTITLCINRKSTNENPSKFFQTRPITERNSRLSSAKFDGSISSQIKNNEFLERGMILETSFRAHHSRKQSYLKWQRIVFCQKIETRLYIDLIPVNLFESSTF